VVKIRFLAEGVNTGDVLKLVENGSLAAYQFSGFVRIFEDSLEQFLEACAINQESSRSPSVSPISVNRNQEVTRLCRTFAGRRTFRVSGHVHSGAKIWPGEMRYPIHFPRDKFAALLAVGRSREEMKVGLSFGGPEGGSLGEWIQVNLPTKMNPACYVAGLLIEEGYAERARPGVIRFLPTSAVAEHTGE
jgi:hypothetical protein